MRPSRIHAVIACAVCIGAVVGYLAWYAFVGAKSATVADLQSQIDAKTKTAGRIAVARAALSEIAGDETAVQSYFVPETGVVAFIDDIEARGIAQKAIVSVLSVSKDATGAHSTLTFTLSITGTFDAVLRTVGTIEYAPYDLSLASLSLGQDDKNAWHANAVLLVGSVSASATASTTGALPSTSSGQATSPQAKP